MGCRENENRYGRLCAARLHDRRPREIRHRIGQRLPGGSPDAADRSDDGRADVPFVAVRRAEPHVE